jgi:hypothetical protein
MTIICYTVYNIKDITVNEFILVEFISDENEASVFMSKIGKLDKEEFQRIETVLDIEDSRCRVYGKISSTYATVIKLQDPYFANHMRVSYISDELKNKYRR